MNTSTHTSFLAQMSAPRAAAPATSTKTLASLLLAAGVAALVVVTNQMMDNWAESHVLASWVALWAVAVVALTALRGVTRILAQSLMKGLDAWSAQLARSRADQRLWAMAQTDSRMMRDLQVAIDRAEQDKTPAPDLTTLKARKVSRMVHNRFYYI